MMFAASFLQSAEVTGFVLALIHSLWQGVVWVVLLAAALRLLSAKRPNLRYAAALFALVGMVVTFLGTWSALGQHSESDAAISATEVLTVLDEDHVVAHEGGDHAAHAEQSTGTQAVASPPIAKEPSAAMSWLGAGWKSNLESAMPYLAVAWGIGALLFLTRSFISMVTVRSLLSGPECHDERLLRILGNVQHRLGSWTVLRIVLTDRLDTPAIWGVLRPVLLLPATLATSLSDADLEAIFAHEIAHLQRYDIAVNFLQLVLESCFFFNPAVWWLSRQVRSEREACCDAVASQLVASPVTYARMLTNFVETHRPAPAAMSAMSGDGGSLLDRVRRLLIPGYRPAMQLSFWTCCLLLALTCGGLYALHEGTEVAVQMMSDEERIEVVQQQTNEVHPNGNESTIGSITVSGQVVTFDGEPVQRIHVTTCVKSPGSTNMAGQPALGPDGKFSYTLSGSSVSLFFNAPGYAPAVAGPFTLGDAEEFVDRKVVLTAGNDIQIKVVDLDGQPAEGVRVTASAMTASGNGTGITNEKLMTDEQGLVTIPHVPDKTTISLSLSGAGYQELQPADSPLVANEVYTFSIQRARPTTGVVVAANGTPVSSVGLKELFIEQPGQTSDRGALNAPVTKTDDAGRFELDNLRDGYTYTYLLVHPDYPPAVLTDVEAGMSDLRVELSPGVSVHGIISEDALKEPNQRINWMPRYRPKARGSYWRDIRGASRKIEVDEQGRFTLHHVPLGEISIGLNGSTTTYTIKEPDQLIVVKPKVPDPITLREVVLRFKHLGKQVSPQGAIKVSRAVDETGTELGWNHPVPVESGEVRFRVKVGDRISSMEPDGLIGFWFTSHNLSDEFRLPVEAGETPLELWIDCHPAGAITGRLIDQDGKPISGRGVGVKYHLELTKEQAGDGRFHSHSGGLDNFMTNSRGEFVVSPVPLHAECFARASIGFNRAMSKEIVLTESAPTTSVDLQLGVTTDLVLTVLSPSGKPLRGIPVKLELQHPDGGQGWSPPAITDAKGQVTFEKCTKQYVKYYKAIIEDQSEYIPVKVDLSASPKTVQLENGCVVRGRVLDQAGKPVVGATMNTFSINPDVHSKYLTRVELKEKTDNEGRFEFRNLPPVPLRVNAVEVALDSPPEVTPSFTKPHTLTLQGKVASWFKGE
ncbi:MAG: M48 family metalloprotease [Planctomycetaceae bacterium]|nr:M48 family metalloprotease [Planctomycetaceae bacterium]